MSEAFEAMLTGGHPNSLGRTIEVVDSILADTSRFDELFNCYQSTDAIVRLRTSNAMKRVQMERPQLLLPYIDRFIEEIGALDQASAQWTLAQLFAGLAVQMSEAQRHGAVAIMKRNVASHDDWIVLNATMETLADWARNDDALRAWLIPHLKRLSGDRRKSVSKKAGKKLAFLS